MFDIRDIGCEREGGIAAPQQPLSHAHADMSQSFWHDGLMR